MANTVNLVTKFLEAIDRIYKEESKTAMLDPLIEDIPFAAANAVKVMKMSAVGLGNYSRVTGYPVGDITATWETMTLAAERGRELSLDRMDNEEMLGLVLGNLLREWTRVAVAPEVDAYRFAKYYAATNGNNRATPANLTNAASVLAAVDTAHNELDLDEVPGEGRKLFISTTCYRLLTQALSRTWSNDGNVDRSLQVLDKAEVIPVPPGRFWEAITLNAGASSSAGGFTNSGSTYGINFLLLHPSAVLQPIKLNQVKYFSPEVNQKSDGHLWQYRLYHDAFVYENKVNGIYGHARAS